MSNAPVAAVVKNGTVSGIASLGDTITKEEERRNSSLEEGKYLSEFA